MSKEQADSTFAQVSGPWPGPDSTEFFMCDDDDLTEYFICDDEDLPFYGTGEDFVYPGCYGKGPSRAAPRTRPGRPKKNKKGSQSKKEEDENENHRYVKLEYVPGMKDGPIKFSHEDCLTVEEAWGIVLIGYFDGKFPGKQAMLQLRNDWKVKTTLRKHRGWFVFNFDSKDDKNKVLSGGPYFAHGTKLVLQKLPFLFNFEKPPKRNSDLQNLLYRVKGFSISIGNKSNFHAV